MISELPLVSCIMPTRDRPAFVRRAIELFLAQDYPCKQLCIVEDGIGTASRVGEVVYTHCAPGLSIGAKRNLACERADGDLIAHWDDDDWNSSRRLSTQVNAMREQGARLSGLDRLVFYDDRLPRAWLFQTTRRPWLAGGTLVYEKSLWCEQPFTEVSDGEDVAFVDAAVKRGAKVAAITDLSLYVAILHGGNTTKRNIDAQWGGFDVETVRRWTGESGGVHART